MADSSRVARSRSFQPSIDSTSSDCPSPSCCCWRVTGVAVAEYDVPVERARVPLASGLIAAPASPSTARATGRTSRIFHSRATRPRSQPIRVVAVCSGARATRVNGPPRRVRRRRGESCRLSARVITRRVRASWRIRDCERTPDAPAKRRPYPANVKQRARCDPRVPWAWTCRAPGGSRKPSRERRGG